MYGEQLYPALLDYCLKPQCLHPEFEFADLRFVETFQPFDVEGSGDVPHRKMRPRSDTVDVPRLLADDGGGGSKGDPYVRDCCVGRILDRDFLDDRDIVLRRSEIDPLQRAMPLMTVPGLAIVLAASLVVQRGTIREFRE